MCFESKTLNSLKSLVEIALISVDDFLSSSVLDSEFLQEKIRRKVKINRSDFMINIFIKNTKNRTLKYNCVSFSIQFLNTSVLKTTRSDEVLLEE